MDFLNTPIPKLKMISLFVSSPLKSVRNYGIAWIGLNFNDRHDFQPKIRRAFTYAIQCAYQFNRSAFRSSNPEKIPNRKSPFLVNNLGILQLFWGDIFTILFAPGRASNDFHFINQKYYIIISRAKACGGCTISISGIAITENRNYVRGKRISRGNFI